MNRTQNFVLLGMIILALIGCTDKENLTGYPGPQIQPREVTSQEVLAFESFRDSAAAYSVSPYLYIGDREGSRFLSFLRFFNFDDVPDSVTIVPGSASIRLVRHEDDVSQVQPQVAEMDDAWSEIGISWEHPQEDLEWAYPEHNYQGLDVPASWWESDSLFIPLPDTLVNQWVQSDTAGYGVVLFSGEPYTRFYSSESPDSLHPLLRFSWLDEDQTKTESISPLEDAFIYQAQLPADEWIHQKRLANIEPVSVFIEYDLSLDWWNQMDADIVDMEMLKDVSIIQAVIEFSIDENLSQFDETFLSVFSYHVEEEIDTAPVLPEQYNFLPYQSGMFNYSSYDRVTDGLVFSIDVTPSLQYITSRDDDNHGFVIRSRYMNRDLTNLVFESDIQPVLRILYSVPGLEE